MTDRAPDAGGRGPVPVAPALAAEGPSAAAAAGEPRPRRRAVGGVALAATLPGAPQLLAGRWGAGATALLVWLACLVVLATRWERVRAAVAGPLDARLAVAALALGLAAAWAWSVRDARRPPTARFVGIGQWALAVRAFSRNRTAVVGAMVVLGFYLVAALTPLLAPYDPAAQENLLTQRLLQPGPDHPLGTDQFARDVFSRLLYGARVSLSIGFVAVGISVTIGTLLGAISGFSGGRVDTVTMRFVDVVISFPRLVLLILIVALFEPSIFLIVTVLGLTQWPGTARIVRSEVLSLREREFVQAARALGFGRARILLRHVVPNVLAPVIVAATLGIGNTIVLEAGLSFLGLGVQPPTPSWGSMVADGRNVLVDAWWVSTFPGLAIVMVVLSFNLVGDGLRDALDPRLRGGS